VTVTTSTNPTKPNPLSFPALVAKVRSGVIRIETTTCGGLETGTGILIGQRLVATVEHVVDGASSIALAQNGTIVGHGTVIGSDPARDVALVRSDMPIAGYRFRFAGRAPQLGESVAALGFPLGLPLTVTRGSVSGSDRTIPIGGIDRTQLVQTDAAVNPGNSGGPLMTDSGRVVGLVDLGTNRANGVAFAVSADVAGPLIQSWTTAPQPIPNQNCSSATAPPPSTTTAPTSLTYTGQDFSIEYPSNWQVSHLPESGGNVDSTFAPAAGGGDLMRVDENPTVGAISLQAAAAPVIAALEKDPSYVNLGVTSDTFDGYPALRWEFQDTENGVQMHKVDEFLIDSAGHGWGILIEAPESVWGQDGPALDSLRQTFNVNPPQQVGGQGLGDWPGGSGYTVILASKISETAARNVQSQAAANGLNTGILYSTDFRSLRPGYWVVFSGVYATQPEAAQAAVQARALGFTDAYSRFVSP
jgi:hypothetical protein